MMTLAQKLMAAAAQGAEYTDVVFLTVGDNLETVTPYVWTSTGWGAQLAELGFASSISKALAINSAGSWLCASTGFSFGNNVEISVSGCGTGYLSSMGGYNQYIFNSSDSAVLGVHDSSPYITAYHWDNSTREGSAYSAASALPAEGNDMVFNPAGDHIIVACSGTGSLQAIEWDDTTGFGSILTAAVSPQS